MGLLGKANNESIALSPDADKGSVIASMEEYSRENTSFHCIVVKTDLQTLDVMIDKLGLILELNSGNCLVLVPANIDRKLLSYHIKENSDTDIIYQCAADNAAEAIINLKPFL